MPRALQSKWALALITISAFINALTLTGSLFMLQVYDRVLTSRSMETLIGLFTIVALSYGILALLEAIRGRILTRLSADYEQRLSSNLMLRSLSPKGRPSEIAHAREIEFARAGLSSPAFAALFDVPWIPLYLALVFALHPMLGWLTVLGASTLCVVATASAYYTKRIASQAVPLAIAKHENQAAIQANSDAIVALGMGPTIAHRWLSCVSRSIETQIAISDRQQSFATVSRNFRQFLQSGLLAAGAYLVIKGEMSGGAIIASSIIGGKALAPVEAIIAGWSQLSSAAKARTKLVALELESTPSAPAPLEFQKPQKSLRLDKLSATVANAKPLFSDISASFPAGAIVALIGPSGSGKTTLLRALTGLNSASSGRVLFDDVPIGQWDIEKLGSSLGYLPQDFQLLDGTIADIISRSDPNRNDANILSAARRSGIHEIVALMPDGYNTVIGSKGLRLSGGQKQRLAMARAVYGDPFVLLLDEPNSNLDKSGDDALCDIISTARAAGKIVVIATHRPELLAEADYIIRLPNGTVHRIAQASSVVNAA